MSEDIKRETVMNTLRNKIGSVHALRSIFTHTRVEAGQKVIDTVKKEYFDNIQELLAAFQAGTTDNINPKEIYEATKSLKSQAEGLGFIFLMEISNGFYKYLQGKVDVYAANPKTEFDKDEKVVVQQYSAAILSALKRQERGKGGIVEADILNSLELLKNRYSAKSGS